MTLPIVLRDEAKTEFDEAFDYYDAQRIGLGAEFAKEIERAFDRIVALPRSAPLALADIRKAFVRRFPYRVFYRVHPDRIEVIAVFHMRRDPTVWQDRI